MTTYTAETECAAQAPPSAQCAHQTQCAAQAPLSAQCAHQTRTHDTVIT